MAENEEILTADDIAGAVDINEEHNWKDEVLGLLEEIQYLKGEISANQLMVGLILKEVGNVKVLKADIGKGLAGHHIEIDEVEDGLVFSLAEGAAGE